MRSRINVLVGCMDNCTVAVNCFDIATDTSTLGMAVAIAVSRLDAGVYSEALKGVKFVTLCPYRTDGERVIDWCWDYRHTFEITANSWRFMPYAILPRQKK